MANKYLLQQGTAKSWKASGGDYAFTPKNIANDAARGGAKGDLGATWARKWWCLAVTKLQAAPTDGKELEVYWCASTNATAGTDNPGNLAGTDGAVTNPDQVKRQLIPIGAVSLSNGIGTAAQHAGFAFFPPTRYGFPVWVNKSGQTLTNTDGDHTFTMTPIEDIDAAA